MFTKVDSIQYIQLQNNLQIAYSETGHEHKECILFIHGLANYAGVWHWNIHHLKSKYRCIAIDLPGNGHSSRGDYPYTMPFYVFIIREFIKAMKLGKVHIMGHSMGGQIALHTAIHHGDEIGKLILSAPAGFEYYSPSDASLFKSAIALGNFLAMDEMQIAQSINTSFYAHPQIVKKIISDLQEIIAKNDRGQYRKMLENSIHSMLDEQVFQHLREIKNPVLCFFGENDQLIPNRFLHPQSPHEIGERACKEIANAQLITYPKTGHFVHIEQANEVNKEVLKFLGEG
ncbi:MAG: alpha/beta hydrolase [Bacteroidetes bacterium]|nr:alpha/beta hydrolase [Bacteroidota bacterium]